MEGSLTPRKTASDYFREAFPLYLATGMSYEEFWEKESWLVKSYREAQKIKRDEINYSAWLHGIYVLDALHTGIPVVLNGIAKSRIELPKYPETPLDLMEKNKEEQEKKQMELQKAKMHAMVEAFNATFRRKHGMEDKK